MLAVTADEKDSAMFQKSVAMSVDLLRKVEKQFKSFCRQHKRGPSAEPIGPGFWIGEISGRSQNLLGGFLDTVLVRLDGTSPSIVE